MIRSERLNVQGVVRPPSHLHAKLKNVFSIRIWKNFVLCMQTLLIWRFAVATRLLLTLFRFRWTKSVLIVLSVDEHIVLLISVLCVQAVGVKSTPHAVANSGLTMYCKGRAPSRPILAQTWSAAIAACRTIRASVTPRSVRPLTA